MAVECGAGIGLVVSGGRRCSRVVYVGVDGAVPVGAASPSTAWGSAPDHRETLILGDVRIGAAA